MQMGGGAVTVAHVLLGGGGGEIRDKKGEVD